MDTKATVHEPVLLLEVIAALAPQDGDLILDLTLGGGGHAEALLSRADVRLIGVDADPEAIARAGWTLAKFKDKAVLCHSNFRDVGSVLEKLQIEHFDKALFDLGLSSDELELSARGFSFKEDEPLLMTFNPSQHLTALDLLQHLGVEQLTGILKNYGEEKYAYRIATAIVEARGGKQIETTHQLVEVIKNAVPQAYAKGRIHPATKTFQALRIAVNDELSALEDGLKVVWGMLNPKGRMAVISFHSLEDRIVKIFMKSRVEAGEGILQTKKPVIASEEEVSMNPRSRSAKLRVLEKTI